MYSLARVSTKELAHLCRRLSTSLEAGLDIRKVLEHEANGRAPWGMRSRMIRIHEDIAGGGEFTDAIRDTGEYFPPLFREMTAVGEETGQLAEILKHLAEHYDHQLFMRRVFLGSIAWPMLQFAAALMTIGLLIWIMGILPKGENGKPQDLLGFGLIGTPGLMIYLAGIAAVAGAFFLFFQSVKYGMLWTAPFQRLACNIPVLGGALQTLALSRIAWSLHLTLETSMELRKALTLSLRSTNNARYTDHAERVADDVTAGREIHETLADTGAYPREFLDALEVGERAGRLPETMGILSGQYQDKARRALTTLTAIAGFVVWAGVAAIIIALIFRLMAFYTGAIYDAMEM